MKNLNRIIAIVLCFVASGALAKDKMFPLDNKKGVYLYYTRDDNGQPAYIEVWNSNSYGIEKVVVQVSYVNVDGKKVTEKVEKSSLSKNDNAVVVVLGGITPPSGSIISVLAEAKY